MDQNPQPSTQRLTELFASLIDEDLEEEYEIITLRPNELLFKEGDPADSLYVLKAGMLSVRVSNDDGSESEIARIVPGAVVGEMALLSGSTRSASVYAINDAGLLRINEEQFQQIVEQDQQALVQINETAAPRWQRQQIFHTLRAIIGEIDPIALDALQEQLSWHYFANGEIIFKQGDPSDGMYFVINGRLRATLTRADGSKKDLGTIDPGQPLGEMGVLSDAPRSATIHAVSETNLVKLTSQKFKHLTRQYPQLMISIAQVIVQRQRRLLMGDQEPQQKESMTIAVIPGSINIDAAIFARSLAESFQEHGSSIAITSFDFDQKYGDPLASQTAVEEAGNLAIVPWMHELDHSKQVVIYAADPFDSPWTRRVINHAQRVLILAHTSDDPQPGEAEKLLADREVPLPTDLIFIGPPPQNEINLAPWLEPRSISAHHFLLLSSKEHLDQLARQLLT